MNYPTLHNTILSLYGKSGQDWLIALPARLKTLAKQLRVTLGDVLEPLTHHYVTSVMDAHGRSYVLKCGYPNDGLHNEIEALRYFNGQGVVQLIQADAKAGWLLMEQCRPGTTLTQLAEDEAMIEAVQTMQALWKPIDSDDDAFPSIRDWLQGLDRARQTSLLLPDRLLANALAVRDELLNSLGERIVLHGDLHHDNILKAGDTTCLAIDPKGVVGEREYEVGALMRNPLSLMACPVKLDQLLRRRFALVSEFTHFECERLIMWSFVQAVLSAVWLIEDKMCGEQAMMHCAEVLYQLLMRRG